MSAPAPRTARVDSLDVLRGLVMVVMALDHTRDFWHRTPFDPTDATQTTPALFATRWITHLCAPTFVLLAGASAWLRGRRATRAELARYLATRGLWLVVLELTVVKLGWQGPTFDATHYNLMVIWALGWSLVALAALIWLPRGAIAAIGAAMVLGHDALDGVDPARFGDLAWLWRVLHAPGAIGDPSAGGWGAYVLYPLVPWIGVMALGYAAGDWLGGARPDADPRRRARGRALVGIGMLAAFVALRAFDRYGDPSPWTPQATSARTAMSFLDLTKYPPSLDYLLATLGVAALALAAIERGWAPLARALRTFGRAPLFFYLVHLPLIGTAAVVAFRVEHGRWLARGDAGEPLPVVYLAWALAVIALYAPCRWFAGVKARRRGGWLDYL